MGFNSAFKGLQKRVCGINNKMFSNKLPKIIFSNFIFNSTYAQL
jgi:hypothetical protein